MQYFFTTCVAWWTRLSPFKVRINCKLHLRPYLQCVNMIVLQYWRPLNIHQISRGRIWTEGLSNMSHLPRSLNHDSVFLNVPSRQCDQMLEVQSSQNTSKSCPNCSLLCFTSIDLLQNSPSHRSCWATFVSKFDANNFQKSPNMVTLRPGLLLFIYGLSKQTF